MEAEGQLALGGVGGALQRRLQHGAQVPAAGGHRGGIPEAQQGRLHPAHQPGQLRIGGVHRQQHLAGGNAAALGDGADAQGQPAAVPINHPLPALAVEGQAVQLPDLGCFLKISLADGTGEGLLQDDLQPEEQRLGVFTAAAFEIGPHGGEIAGVLEPVAALIAVGVEQKIEVHGVHSARNGWLIGW